MATADEILEQMENNPELYAADPEEICVIDNDLRTITIPSDIQNVGVESDEDVRRLNFQMPKQYGEVDLSEFDIRINFMNANNQGDVYAVTDKQVTGDNITFSWLVGRNALAYRGSIRFIVCLKKTDAEGVVQQEFNTTIAQLTVLEGLETTEAVVAENPDIIEQILQRLDDLEENGGGGGTPGKDGREIEIQNNGTAIQWRYVGDESWTDLVQLSSLKGEKGDKGDTGDTGPQGETGERGPAGPQGEIGPQGPVGPAGKDGAQGPKGDTGEQGPQGPKGDTGATPNIQIGTVQTLDSGQDATATITGSPENPLLNLGIPKGEKGDDGSGEGGEPYELPIMSETQLGGGKAVSKTDEDVPVAVDPSTGQLFVPTYPENTAGGGGGGTEQNGIPSGGTTGQVLTKRSNTDNDVVWRSGISGKNEDDNSDYNIVTKIKDGNLTAILEYTSHSPSPGGDDLDVVAINGKTYREIFIDGNKIQWGDFENGSEGFQITSGTPTLSEEECVSRTHSLKAFGEVSQQYRINNAYSHTNSTSVYIALKAKCDRHIKGTLGFTNGNVTVGASDKTNGFETYSVIDRKSGIKSCFIGSISSANLDGYVDDIVVINITEIFGDSVPEKEMLDNAYNNYISIITSDSDNIPSVASAPKTEEYILSSNKHIEYTDTECVSAFMELVNRKAEYYGMANSNFTSPSGAGGNTSCAKDLAIAGYYACGYRDILDVWKHKQYDVKVYGPNEREINVRSTVMNTPIGDYTVHGGKTGSWAGTENLLVVAEVNNEVFACVVMDCGSSQNRFVAMGELLDVISSSSGEVSTASAACVYKIPAQIPQLHNISEETAIYTKNDTQEIIPASVTKVMTAITALDYADSLSEKILFKPSDLESGSGAIFQAGDIITLNDALVAMLLPSSNMAAKAVARNIGKKYLERFGK